MRLLLASLAFAACADPAPPAPQWATVTLAIEGMHCSGCAMAITEAVEKVGGVSRCQVNLEDKSAQVELDAAQVTAAEVVAVITGLGYRAGRPGEVPAAEPEPAPAPATDRGETETPPAEPPVAAPDEPAAAP